MTNDLLIEYQLKHAKLEYLLKLLQIYVMLKKEFQLQMRIEQEILKLAEAELPPLSGAANGLVVA